LVKQTIYTILVFALMLPLPDAVQYRLLDAIDWLTN
jgi:hypothetical protein